MKRLFALLLAIFLLIGCTNTAVHGIIQWGEGGGTDMLMRPLCTLAEPHLSGAIAVRNMTGGTGTRLYTLLGMLAMALAGVGLIMSQKRRFSLTQK